MAVVGAVDELVGRLVVVDVVVLCVGVGKLVVVVGLGDAVVGLGDAVVGLGAASTERPRSENATTAQSSVPLRPLRSLLAPMVVTTAALLGLLQAESAIRWLLEPLAMLIACGV